MTAGTLFPDCVLPACKNPVTEHGEACTECVEAFGPMLARKEGEPMTETQIAERDAEIRAALRIHRETAVAAEPETKRNQVCWLCTERHTCTRTDQGWECGRCELTDA